MRSLGERSSSGHRAWAGTAVPISTACPQFSTSSEQAERASGHQSFPVGEYKPLIAARLESQQCRPANRSARKADRDTTLVRACSTEGKRRANQSSLGSCRDRKSTRLNSSHLG